MDQGQSSTGTRDSTYDLVAVLYHALQGIENCQTYRQDASGDQQMGQFFDQAIQAQRQLADQAKRLLHDRLMQETSGGQGGMSEEAGGGSAFQFSGDSPSGMSGSGGGQTADMHGGGEGQFGTGR